MKNFFIFKAPQNPQPGFLSAKRSRCRSCHFSSFFFSVVDLKDWLVCWLDAEYWMIYRGPSFLFLAVIRFGSTYYPPPFPLSKIDQRRKGRLRKRDKPLKEEAWIRIIRPHESLSLYKSFITLWVRWRWWRRPWSACSAPTTRCRPSCSTPSLPWPFRNYTQHSNKFCHQYRYRLVLLILPVANNWNTIRLQKP